MSSILKALKKLEEQKAARPRYEVDLSSGVVRERRMERRRPWIIPAGMCAVAIIAALVTYGTMSLKRANVEKPLPVTTAPPSSASSPTIDTPPRPLPAPPVTAPEPVLKQSVKATSDFSLADRGSTITSRQQSQKRSSILPLVSPPSDRRIDHDTPPAVSIPQTERKPEKPPQPRLPEIKLTGIAWQKDSASRYAVLNGVALSEGATVEGARIDEILPDRVRFSLGDRSFDIPLGSQQRNN